MQSTLQRAATLAALLVMPLAAPFGARAQAVRGDRSGTVLLDNGLYAPLGHANVLGSNDDGSTGLVDIGFTLNFYGTAYDKVYVNNNGNLTFSSGMGTYTPFGLTSTNQPIIAPYFGDVDTRTLRPYPSGTPAAVGRTSYASYGALSTFASPFGRSVFSVTWSDVGYYGAHVDKTNTFQLNLIDRGDRGAGDFDIEFDYDQVRWETGDASGGSGGFGGTPAVMGFSKGTSELGTFVQWPGSFVSGALVDGGSNALVSGSFGSATAGRYLFEVQNQTPILPGTTQDNPFLPSSSQPGDPEHGIVPVYFFNNAPSGYWYDPLGAWGYEYETLGGSLFTGVGLPTGFADPFDLFADGISLGHFLGGTLVDFDALLGHGVDEFRITGINPLRDPNDPSAFPVQLYFDQTTGNRFSMTPLTTSTPEPSTYLLLGGGLALLAAARRRRKGA